MCALCSLPAVRPAPRGERGVSLVEVLAAVGILLVGLLANVSSTLGESRLAQEQVARGRAMALARQMVESLRSSPDFAGLYVELRTAVLEAEDPNREGERLEDGRIAWPPERYDTTLSGHEELASFRVLVDVPADTAADGTGAETLREHALHAAWGLPADLDGDGAIDDEPRDGDYRVLPVVLRILWRERSGRTAETWIPVWLRGDR